MKENLLHHYMDCIFVNMPYKILQNYINEILSVKMFLEIGISGNDLDKINVREFGQLADTLDKKGVVYNLHGPFWDLCPGSVDPLISQASYLRLQQLLDIAQVMNPLHIVIHTGYDPRHHRGQRDLWLDRAINCWVPVIERAERMQIKIVVENVWEEDPYLHEEIFNRLRDYDVGFCLDLGHQNCFSRTDISTWLNRLAGYIAELHIHDNNGLEDSHSPPGSGKVDFNYLFSFLESNEIYPLLNVEPHTEEDFIKTFKNLRNLIPREFFYKYCKALAKKARRS